MRIAEIFLKASNSLKFLLFLPLLFVPAALFGGWGKIMEFSIQAFILGVFLLYFTNLCFYKTTPSYFHYDNLRVPCVIFSCFIAYVFVQWLGGHLVFLKVIPGSLARYRTMDFLIQLVCYAFFFFLCLDFLTTRKRVQFITFLLALEVIFLISLGYYQEYSQPQRFTSLYGFFPLRGDYMAYYASFTNQNQYGGFLVLANILLLASVLYYVETTESEFQPDYSLFSNLFFFILTPLTIASMFDAMARAAFIAELVVLFMMVNIVTPRRHRRIAALLMIAVIAGFFLFLRVIGRDDFARFFQSSLAVLIYRVTLWKELSHIFFAFPIFGTGLGTLMYISSQYNKIDAGFYTFFHAINHNLELLTDTGIVGYFLFAVPFIYLVITSVRKCFKSPSRWCHIYGLASFTAMTAALVFSSMDDYLRMPANALLFLFYLAMLVKCAQVDIQDEEDEGAQAGTKIEVTITPRRLAWWFVMVMVVSLIFMRGYHRFVEYQMTKFTAGYNKKGDVPTMEKAVVIRPDDAEAWGRLGDVYLDEAEKSESTKNFKRLIRRSVRAYETALKLVPIWSRGWILLGRARVVAGEEDKGFKDMIHGVELAPYDRNGYLYLIFSYLKASEGTLSEERAAALRDNALLWLKKGLVFSIPFTPEDFDFVNEDTVRGWRPQLTPGDRRLVSDLIKEFYSSS